MLIRPEWRRLRRERIRSAAAAALLTLLSGSTLAQPCWLYAPVTAERSGYIGVATPLDQHGKLAITASRQAAVQQLLRDLKLEASQVANQDLASQSQLTLNGQSYFFSDEYQAFGALFSYVSDTEIPSTNCGVPRCSIARCEPAWLCQQAVNAGIVDVLGIGEWRISDKQQWQDAERSAQEVAAYWGLSDVASDYKMLRASGAAQYYNFVSHDISVLPEQSPARRMRMVSSCRDRARLYQRWQYPDDGKPENKRGETGAGEVSGYTADGSLKSVIDLAIRRAYADLAQKKNINIRTTETFSESTQTSGGFALDVIQVLSQQKVAAKLTQLSVVPRRDKPYLVKAVIQEKLPE